MGKPVGWRKHWINNQWGTKWRLINSCRLSFHWVLLYPASSGFFLQAGRYASMGKKPWLRAAVCFSIEHARPRDDYEYLTTRRQRELQRNNRFNKQNNNFARASRFYFYISLPFLHDYDVKMPNFTFYGVRKQATTKFILLFALELGYGPLEFNSIWVRLHLIK